MNLGEFDKVYAEKANISRKEASEQRRTFIETLKHGLLTDGSVTLRGDLKAGIINVKSTVRRLPNGELITVPAKKRIKITPLCSFDQVLELV